jgi:uncharacterized protein
MPNVSRSSSGRPAHGPLLVPVAELRRRVGNVDEVEGAVALDGAEVLGTRLADGAEATVALRLEALSDAVVITGEAEAPWEGECRRCLEPVSGMAIGDIDEVARTMPLDGELAIEDDRIDLTEAVRAAVVLALPMAPLCSDDCMGPDPEAYPVTVEDKADDDEAPPPDPRWAALSELHPDE